jgi:hypothetical protein
MKTLIENYVFDASAKTIEFTDYFSVGIGLERVLMIVNARTNEILYNIGNPSLGATAATNVLTLTELDSDANEDTDPLLIFYEDPLKALKVSLDSRIAGEDIINDWMKVIVDSDPTRITTATTTVIKSGIGRIFAVCLINPVASATMTAYNNTAASGTVIMSPVLPATLLSSGPSNLFIGGGKFTTGLTILTTGTAEWLFWVK